MTLIHNPQITIVSWTPLLLQQLIRYFPAPHSIRLFVSGGDVLHAQHVDRLIQTNRVFNSYGPTEATVCTTYH
ncbi:AMP-binding protein [Paenibacillus taiwanensis]|uniref:AMP-binding protein n=1 Tax=Paenibacillus taiwanensis TaxID=401638 RepID=UPI0012FAD850